MNKMTKKLLLSVLTVVLTVTALGTTTFAWFTLTNTAIVQPFEAQVVADVGIEVSLDDLANEGVWVTTITTAMIDAYILAKYPTGFFFNAVTTSDGRNMFSFGGETPLAASGGQFLEIGIQFRSNNAEVINWETATLTQEPAGGAPWPSDVAFEHTTGPIIVGGTVSTDVSNGMRMAVDGGALGDIIVYEKTGNALGDPTTGAGNTVLGGLNTTISRNEAGDITGNASLFNGAIAYYYAKTNELPLEVEQFEDVAGELTSLGIYTSTVNTVSTITSFPLDEASIASRPATVMLATAPEDEIGANFYGELTIRIWLEGWDPDTFNAVLSRVVRASFRFSAPE